MRDATTIDAFVSAGIRAVARRSVGGRCGADAPDPRACRLGVDARKMLRIGRVRRRRLAAASGKRGDRERDGDDPGAVAYTAHVSMWHYVNAKRLRPLA